MATLTFVLRVLWATLVVTARRLVRGPRYPTWTYRYELIAEVLRRENERLVGASVETIRRGLPPSRIHESLRGRVRHARDVVGGLPAEVFVPEGWTEGDPVVLYLHGGGYIVCSPATHRDLISRIADAAGAKCIAVDYRKAPEHPFPAAIDDAVGAYRALLAGSVDPERLFLAGDSAGGGLTLATLQRLRAAGLPLPRGAVLLSPWVDLRRTGQSILDNAPFDYLRPHALAFGAEQYLKGQPADHPEASPVLADLSGLPPLLVQTGGGELFLSENVTLVERARAVGVEVDHQIHDGMIHVWQGFASLTPEPLSAIAAIGRFVRARVTG